MSIKLPPPLPGFMSPEQARERKYRIIAEMLLDGCGEAAIMERFGHSGVSIPEVRRKYGIQPQRGSGRRAA